MVKDPSNKLVPVAPGNLTPDRIPGLEALFEGGFAQEETFSIGDPNSTGKKVPVYFGQLIGPGGTILVERPGSKPDPVTGEVQMSELPTYLFNPLDPTTFAPFKQKVDTIICSHQVASACKKYGTLAADVGGKAQILFRWNGKVETRKGNQMNDISTIFRVVDASGNVKRGEGS
jgi:hypothetical protein